MLRQPHDLVCLLRRLQPATQAVFPQAHKHCQSMRLRTLFCGPKTVSLPYVWPVRFMKLGIAQHATPIGGVYQATQFLTGIQERREKPR